MTGTKPHTQRLTRQPSAGRACSRQGSNRRTKKEGRVSDRVVNINAAKVHVLNTRPRGDGACKLMKCGGACIVKRRMKAAPEGGVIIRAVASADRAGNVLAINVFGLVL